MATIYDIAKLANVSAMTVSRVINKTGRVSEKTRIKVQQVMDDMHYIPNSIARCLVTQESKVISLLITDICNPFFTTMARGAEDAAQLHGYRLMFGNSDESLLKERQYVEMILSMKVDGVLFAASNDMSVEHLKWLERNNVPYVLLDRVVPGIQADTVLGDSREGTKRMVEQLIAMGHKRIGLVNGLEHVSTARDRKMGFIEALAEAGLAVDERYFASAGYLHNSELHMMDNWIAIPASERPTAIFAANNMLALSLLKEARALGIRVPEDVSIACFDELGLNDEAQGFMSVVSQPAYEFGKLGFKLLHERMKDRTLDPRMERLPCEIKMRDSVAPYSSHSVVTSGALS